MTSKTICLCAESSAVSHQGGIGAPGGAGALAAAAAAPTPALAGELGAVLERAGAEEPPLLWAGPAAADHPRVRDAVRYAALELHEHLQTYFDRREHTLEVLFFLTFCFIT